MVFYRVLEQNGSKPRLEELKNALHQNLAQLDPHFQWGVIGTTLVPVRYLALPVADDQQLGYELMISFWAWGNSEAETMSNLGRLLKNLSRALRKVSAKIAPG
jgi:hypothetical protein